MYINDKNISITKIDDKEFVLQTLDKINKVTEKIKQYINIQNIRKIKINIYTDRKEFLNDIAKYYKENSIPEYCKGTIQEGEIFYYLDKNYNDRRVLYICQIVHEYIHILYNEYIKKRRKIRLVR